MISPYTGRLFSKCALHFCALLSWLRMPSVTWELLNLYLFNPMARLTHEVLTLHPQCETHVHCRSNTPQALLIDQKASQVFPPVMPRLHSWLQSFGGLLFSVQFPVFSTFVSLCPAVVHMRPLCAHGHCVLMSNRPQLENIQETEHTQTCVSYYSIVVWYSSEGIPFLTQSR